MTYWGLSVKYVDKAQFGQNRAEGMGISHGNLRTLYDCCCYLLPWLPVMVVGVTFVSRLLCVPRLAKLRIFLCFTVLHSLPTLPVFIGCYGYANAPDMFSFAGTSCLVICVKMKSTGQKIVGGPPA